MSRGPMRVRPRLEWLYGGALDAREDILRFYRRCEQEGGVIKTHIWRLPIHVVTAPDLIEEVLIRKQRCFIKSAGLRSTRLAFGQGLLTSDRDLWLRQRRTIQAAFHARQLKLYGRLMEDACRRLLDTFGDGQVRNIHHDMTELCFEVLARSLFGEELPEAQELLHAARSGGVRGATLSRGDPAPERQHAPARGAPSEGVAVSPAPQRRCSAAAGLTAAGVAWSIACWRR